MGRDPHDRAGAGKARNELDEQFLDDGLQAGGQFRGSVAYLLQQLVDEDVSNAAFKFMDHRSMEIAHCPALINRVTYTGDLGYEIWVTPEYQRRLYQEIMRAGEAHGHGCRCERQPKQKTAVAGPV